MYLGDREVHGEQETAETFAEYFGSVYEHRDVHPEKLPFKSNNIPDLVINDRVIKTAISSLKNSYYPGPDGIPASIIKCFGGQLLYPLRWLFSESIGTGSYPDIWKLTFIRPHYKRVSLRTLATTALSLC